ncbi:hypothetical protein EXIGLDRAFT_726539 [Exidia glandulosa HHB12029]|uniref:Exonuclease domain-containing protein n=1 Tax=Exidia glandulosa HHB12029 TaxID=1314781 RepID=A0A165MCI3_EXIGL|nr:hypothetical protein EXIGLDRAFT_726539 [Exidia glandulosa HHB12029]
MSSSPLQYLCILDFESTCGAKSTSGWDRRKQEIIEFPVLVYNLQTREVDHVFHEYVRPTLQPKLTEFCTDLTGIEQGTVDGADPFIPVWKRFTSFVAEHLPEDPAAFAFLTCGGWDLKTMLPMQLAHAEALTKGKPPTHSDYGSYTVPIYMQRWINIKTRFSSVYGAGAGGMAGMLQYLHLSLEGRHHSGIDDCKNIARIVSRMLDDGWVPTQPSHGHETPTSTAPQGIS